MTQKVVFKEQIDSCGPCDMYNVPLPTYHCGEVFECSTTCKFIFI